MRPTWSPTVRGISHQPSAHARIPRSFQVRAYSAMRSSAAAGIAPSEWLIRYVVCSRIGNRSRYSVNRMPRSLGGLAPQGPDPSTCPRPARPEAGVRPLTGSDPLVQAALRRSDITCRRAEQPARALLLEDVRRPACDARAREHRGCERRGDLRNVEDDGGVVLDIRGEHAVRRALLQS